MLSSLLPPPSTKKKYSSRRQIPATPPAFDPRARVSGAPAFILEQLSFVSPPPTIPPQRPDVLAGKYWSCDGTGRIEYIFSQQDSGRDAATVRYAIESDLSELHRLYGVDALIVNPEVAFVLLREEVLTPHHFIKSVEGHSCIPMSDVQLGGCSMRIEVFGATSSYPDFEFRVSSHPQGPCIMRGRSYEDDSFA